jgi:hypothetical protein
MSKLWIAILVVGTLMAAGAAATVVAYFTYASMHPGQAAAHMPAGLTPWLVVLAAAILTAVIAGWRVRHRSR